MNTPRVSVLMPVRTGMPFLEQALASLSAQTLADIEVLVLDDGSTDGTGECVASWPDARVRAITTGGVGVGAALQIGLREARAAMVARHDADGISQPRRLEKQVAFLDRYKHVDLVGCIAEYIDADGRAVDNDWVRTVRSQQDLAVTPDQIRDLMPATCCIASGSIVARAAVLRAAGGYRPDVAPVEDYDLWLRLLPEAELAKLPERLYQQRVDKALPAAEIEDIRTRRALAARLAYVRRVAPALPEGARLAIVGGARGGDYQAVAPDYGFTAVATRPALERNHLSLLSRASVRRGALEAWDVLAVTDVSALDAYKTAFPDTDERTLVRVGNFFVKREFTGNRIAA